MPGVISAIQPAGGYPSPDLPAVQLVLMIVVPVGLLFVWLILVYLAARPGRGHRRPALRPQVPLPRDSHAVAGPDTADTDIAGMQPQLTPSTRS